MYQTGGTIKETIELVQRHEYVLPAIQREFVWKPEQIQRLFDSLMQGYPFGTFLLWRVEAEEQQPIQVLRLSCATITNGTTRIALRLPLQNRSRHRGARRSAAPHRLEHRALRFDGRQAAGSGGAIPTRFPLRHLYLDLLASTEPNEEGDRYRFEFLTQQQIEQADPSTTCWFKVGDILTMESGPECSLAQ